MKSIIETNTNKKTMSVKDFCSEYGIGQNKAYELDNVKGFPMIRCGKKIIIIGSKMDGWIEIQLGKSF
ncbi:DNA-binding protein [Clostridium sp. C8-1-8]|uniref:DNA-binding protein n=1 Tax=Clostridium sp. C8-1-8 TaxID=2698831 RepID=UPI00136E40ED|nr:DNA-binding protein [Clostridium sp. C8-1-8]